MELIEKGSDAAPGSFDGSFCGLAQKGFELGKNLLNGIEVWAVGRQEEEPGADRSDDFAHGLRLVTSKIVDDDDVSGTKRRQQELFDIGEKALPIDRPVEHARGLDTVAAQRRQESECSPVALRHLGQEPVPTRRPPAQTCHVGLGPGLVDEDQPGWIKPALMRFPAPALSRHVGAILLGCEEGFF